jgi:hypothetical protein
MRNLVTLFVSYAHENKPLVGDFISRLEEQMKPSKAYDYRLWRDTGLLLGEDWDREIKAALQESQFGLLLISPAFLNSDFIKQVELPHFLTIEKTPVLPVMLEPVDIERHDLRGLEQKQIFQWVSTNAKAGRAYADCKGVDRRRFVEALFRQIEQRLDKLSGNRT